MEILLKYGRFFGLVQKVDGINRQFNTYGLISGVFLYNLYILMDVLASGHMDAIAWPTGLYDAEAAMSA